MSKLLDENLEEFKQCKTCKYFYDLHFDYFDDRHNDCAKEICYLCFDGKCTLYKKGNVPKGKYSGRWLDKY